MRALTLLVRNLAALERADCEHQCPALESFLSRCLVTRNPHNSTVGWTCASFGVTAQQDWPAGAILAQAHGTQNSSTYWICAEPVHLAVDRDNLVLQPRSQLRLSDAESRTLFSVIKVHFADEQLEMHHIDRGLWCIGTNRAQNLSTTEIELAEGRSVDGLLPSGEDARRWQRLVLEAQMILHEHPVNAAREQRGEVAINSLWIWGGGTAPSVHHRFDRMGAVDPLLRAAAVLTQTELTETPGDANELFDDDHALFEFIVQDTDGTGSSLSALETNWILPAWQALGSGRLDELTLVLALPDTIVECRCDRKARRRFWKRRQALPRFLVRWQVSA